MKQIKFIAVVLMMFMSFSISAQEKLKEKAIELTKEFNQKLGVEKLSADQETKMIALFEEKQKEIRTIKKEVTDEEEQKEKIKEVHKAYSKKIAAEILNEKQKLALKEYNKNKN